jgi:type I restriction enzyme, S subunit
MKPGYKKTDVGVIPEEWEARPLRSINFDISDGNYSSKYPKASDFRAFGIPFIRANNIRCMTVVDDDMRFISSAQHQELQKGHLKAKDVLITTRGEIGQVAVVPEHHVGSNINAQLVRINTCNTGVDHRFLLYAMSSEGAQEQLRNLQTGSALKQLPVGRLIQLQLIFPPSTEQRAIAEALSDVDALLGAIERLIAKKRDLKQATMQQLLTGKTRLPGFHGKWEERRLGDLGAFLKGSGVRKDQSQSGTLPCVRYGEIYTRHSNYIKAFHSFISATVAETARLLKKGDLLFAGSGETREEIGKCAAFVDDFEAYAGGDIVILRPQGVDSLFLGFSLNTPPINRQKTSRGQGDAVVHIGSSALADITLNLPPLSEQTAIAEVLREIDTELDGLEQRREKTRALKRGMMQELLTGRTRLVSPNQSHA